MRILSTSFKLSCDNGQQNSDERTTAFWPSATAFTETLANKIISINNKTVGGINILVPGGFCAGIRQIDRRLHSSSACFLFGEAYTHSGIHIAQASIL